MNRSTILCTALLASLLGAAPDLPKPSFYLPFDGSTTAAIAVGERSPRKASYDDPILAIVDANRPRYTAGRVGQCYDITDAPLQYRAPGNFRPDEGACSFWLSPHFSGDNTSLYATFFGIGHWGMLYKYESQSSLTFGTAKPLGDIFYDCGSSELRTWKPDTWHHIALTWSRKANSRQIYLDGKLQAKAPFPFHVDTANAAFNVGGGCDLYPQYCAHARLDEFALWDQPLTESHIREVYQLGSEGKPLWQGAQSGSDPGHTPSPKLTVPPSLKSPSAPPSSTPAPASSRMTKPWRTLQSPTRDILPLAGWWHFQPSQQFNSVLPETAWGWARIPGYWTSRDDIVDPAGRRSAAQWNQRNLTDFEVGYLVRTIQLPPQWKGRQLFLHFDPIDALADIYLNGQRLARLLPWEEESYNITSLLHFDRENTLVLALSMRGKVRLSGIPADLSIESVPDAFTQDMVVQPSVETRQLRLSCNLWTRDPIPNADLEFTISHAAHPDQVAKTFRQRITLPSADRAQPEISSQSHRIDCAFPWDSPHLWTYDDPHLYLIQARLYRDGKLIDQSPPLRFGFREFTQRGADLLLNGKPTHLRGHQIDFGWADQRPHIRELKTAGMNCFEFSAPIRGSWYANVPYRLDRFEEILDYADENGLIAIPILPDAESLRTHILRPEVAALYARRVEKHIRRFGQHPSICLWYMHFNLAGYHWYVAPMKVDGSHKPTDPAFQERERFATAAQRIARQFDSRPIYHHACGDLGDIFTNNCYIGPNSPLQEREEWPSRWAAKRPFPLIACEHDLMLICYWFRPRTFPLSVVYAGEPIFDEIAAMYLGPQAYDWITPDLFDLYDTGRSPRSDRHLNLVRQHPGYQQVGALFAEHALRSWRTYGVTGMIFNAINWDYYDRQGRPNPVLKSLGRYFNDTDLYIAGPGEDWPSKDHAFFAGETVRKQVILLNDLTRDFPCPLTWRAVDQTGRTYATGRFSATARAGTPSMLPIEFKLPPVASRADHRLIVEPADTQHFRPDTFPFQVFPPAKPPSLPAKFLIFDPAGDTTRLLARAGITAQPLTPTTQLDQATCLIVGSKSYNKTLTQLAAQLHLAQAIAKGLNLLAFEQTAPTVLGLKLTERSTRHVFMTTPSDPLLAGLEPADLINLRGESRLIAPYPDAPPGSDRTWPSRFYKWGNRGIVATYTYTRPHYSPFQPILQCGFDLVDSPLLQANIGRGHVVLCQLDITPRYATDPVSTQLVHNLLAATSQRSTTNPLPVICYGQSAKDFVKPFGITASALPASPKALLIVGSDPLPASQKDQLMQAIRGGAIALLLPESPLSTDFSLVTEKDRLYIARPTSNPLTRNLTPSDLFFKSWLDVPTILPQNDWRPLTQPGLLAIRPFGSGRIIACQIDPRPLAGTRAQIKALRLWNNLLTNLSAQRDEESTLFSPTRPLYAENQWEELPPYINW